MATITGDANGNSLPGTSGDDEISGLGGNDTLYGLGGGDTLFGGSGDDTLYGGTGADILRGGGGQDSHYGGSGDDILILGDGEALAGPEIFDGGADYDIFEVIGGSGSPSHDMSNDILLSIEQINFGDIAAGGDRQIRFDAAQFSATGISLTAHIQGWDVADSTETLRVVMGSATSLDLSGLTFSSWGGQGELVSIEGDTDSETITGTSQNDVIDAGDGDDTVYGSDGDDTVYGGDGADYLVYESGNTQSLYGGIGNDTLVANTITSASDDLLMFGGSGIDTYVFTDGFDVTGANQLYLFGGGTDTMLFSSALGDADKTFNMATVEVTNIERVEFAEDGASVDKTVILNGMEFTVTGTEFKNNLTIDGSSGQDTLIIQMRSADTTLDLSAHTFVFENWSSEDVFEIHGTAATETIYGTGGDDTIIGNGGDDEIRGEGGADYLVYESGNTQSLYGGIGNDTLVANTITSASDDLLMFGGSGIDTYVFTDGFDVTGANQLYLFGGGTDTMLFSSALGDADKTFNMATVEVTNIERVEFAEDGASVDKTVILNGMEFTVTGTEFKNNLTIDGSSGQDTLIIQMRSADTTLDLSAHTFVFENWSSEDVFEIHGTAATETIYGTGGDDTIIGNGGDDEIRGEGGADYLVYESGNTQSLYGGIGNDTLVANTITSASDDLLMFGGSGIDTYVFTDGFDVTGANQLYLFGGGTDTMLFSSALGDADKTFNMATVEVTNIERVEFAEDGASVDKTVILNGMEFTVTGTEFKNNLTIDGSSGQDTLIIQMRSADTTLDLSAHTFVFENWSSEDVFEIHGTAATETIYGTGGDDTIIGNGGDDEIRGEGGADYLVYESGNTQSLYGGIGNDTLVANTITSASDDLLMFGGSGIDTYVFTDGFDVTGANQLYLFGGGTDTMLFSSALGDADKTFNMATVEVTNIERVEFAEDGASVDKTVILNGMEFTVTGTEFKNNLTIDGSSGQDTLIIQMRSADTTLDLSAHTFVFENWSSEDVFEIHGTAATETIYGTGGDDTVFGGAGADVLDGGAHGSKGDTLSYADSSAAVNVSLDAGAGLGGDAAGDTIANFENLIGSDHDDTLTGTSGDNTIYGGDGADTLNGLGGVDAIYGGEGADIFIASTGKEHFDGGAGNDTVDYSTETVGSIFDLAGQYFDNGVTPDTWNSIENVIAGSGNDTITGNGGDNSIQGMAGNDRLFGGDGEDILDGGAGQDTVYGGIGNDTFIDGQNGLLANADTYYGGSGTDSYVATSIFWSATTEFNLLTGYQTVSGGIQRDRFFDVENLTVTGDAALTGDNNANILTASDALGAGNNVLNGNGGDDTLIGGGGEDRLYGGDQADNLYGEQGNDTLNGDNGDDRLFGGTQEDDLFGGAGNDALYGEAGFDKLYGGDGEDRLYGGDQADNLYGEQGNDTLNGDNGDDRLFGGTQEDDLFGGAGNDALYGEAGFDKLYGGDGEDRLYGGDQADNLYGEQGNDTLNGDNGDDRLFGGTQEDDLFGGAGNDALYGEAGFDKLHGGDGEDRLYGGDQADNLYGEQGNDTLNGDNGDDRLFGGTQEDDLFGGAGNDALYGEAGFDKLYGGNGEDRLYGGDQADHLYGEAGFDKLYGGAGDDTLTGGAQADTFIFSGTFGSDTITDFEATNDAEDIDLSGVASITDWTDLSTPANGHMYQSGADVIIDDLAGNTITLKNINIGDLDAADFIF